MHGSQDGLCNVMIVDTGSEAVSLSIVNYCSSVV
jgi:hypothetical protein